VIALNGSFCTSRRAGVFKFEPGSAFFYPDRSLNRFVPYKRDQLLWWRSFVLKFEPGFMAAWLSTAGRAIPHIQALIWFVLSVVIGCCSVTPPLFEFEPGIDLGVVCESLKRFVLHIRRQDDQSS